jgi:cation transport ATPase
LQRAKDKNLARQLELEQMRKAKEKFDQEDHSDRIPSLKEAKEKMLREKAMKEASKLLPGYIREAERVLRAVHEAKAKNEAQARKSKESNHDEASTSHERKPHSRTSRPVRIPIGSQETETIESLAMRKLRSLRLLQLLPLVESSHQRKALLS